MRTLWTLLLIAAAGGCVRDPSATDDGDRDAGATEADARLPGDDAGSARPDAGRPPLDARVVDAAQTPRDAEPPGDAAAPPDAVPPDAARPADAGVGPAPDCRALLGTAGEACDPESFPGCSLTFGAGCCAHVIFCEDGRVREGEDCTDDCDQRCGVNPDPFECGLQRGCSWFEGGCDPPAEGFVAGPACIPTPGAVCAVGAFDPECPDGQQCLAYWVDPCAGADCDACGGEAHFCGYPQGDVEPCDPGCLPEGDYSAVPCGADEVGCAPACSGFCRRSACTEALRRVEACFDRRVPPARYDLGWPACGPRDACAAACALELEGCGGLQCAFDGDIDCDGIGPWEECLRARCDGEAECPADLGGAIDAPCDPEGRSCGGEGCADACGFCNLIVCEGGRWRRLEVPPPPPGACADRRVCCAEDADCGAGRRCAQGHCFDGAAPDEDPGCPPDLCEPGGCGDDVDCLQGRRCLDGVCVDAADEAVCLPDCDTQPGFDGVWATAGTPSPMNARALVTAASAEGVDVVLEDGSMVGWRFQPSLDVDPPLAPGEEVEVAWSTDDIQSHRLEIIAADGPRLGFARLPADEAFEVVGVRLRVEDVGCGHNVIGNCLMSRNAALIVPGERVPAAMFNGQQRTVGDLTVRALAVLFDENACQPEIHGPHAAVLIYPAR